MTSGMRIAPLRGTDIPELSQFLIGGFGVPATSQHFSHEALKWKYFDGQSEPSADSACSLVARTAGKIVGHIGLCHRQLIVPGDGAPPVPTLHAIDWLGSAAHPGSGTLLMLQAIAASKTQFAIGGSDQVQDLFPRLGFERKPGLAIFRKVLNPSHRLRRRDEGFFRKWVGTVKNVVSARFERTPPVLEAVELRSVPAFPVEIDHLQRQAPLRIVTCERGHVLLNSLLRCPIPGLSGWTIHASQRMIGYAVLKMTPNSRIPFGTIVDCWLDTADPSFWQAAVAALNDRLRAFSAYYVTAYAVNPMLHAALLLNGFAKRGETNVYVRDKQQLLPKGHLFGLSRFDADGVFH